MSAAPPAAPDSDDFNDGFDVAAPPVLHGVPFAGRARFSILSHLHAAHSSGGGLFGFMTMRESNKLRMQCREARAEVVAFEWMDACWARPFGVDDDSRVLGSVAAWRVAFPAARALNVSRRAYWEAPRRRAYYTTGRDVCDADFAHIRGGPGVRLHTVRMAGCRGVTDAAFAHLRGIHTLDMSCCDQETITDAAFAHLRGIHSLIMHLCGQPTITDAAFAHLRGTHTLVMSDCRQATITDAAFAHLTGIHTLTISRCNQATITDAAFAHLRGIHTLSMSECRQRTITNAAFAHLRGIHTLDMRGCNQETITDVAFAHLRGIRMLDLSECTQHTITGAGFTPLAGIHYLFTGGCSSAVNAAADALFDAAP
jgi:hypothetical protein